MPTIATRSLMPLLAMCAPWRTLPTRTGLPKIVVDALCRKEASKGHLEPVADRHRVRVDVGELAGEAPAALVIDERGHHGRLQRVRQVVERVGRHPARRVGEALLGHLIDGATLDAHALRREMPGATRLAARADEGELPALVPAHGRTGGPLGIRPAWRLEWQ